MLLRKMDEDFYLKDVFNLNGCKYKKTLKAIDYLAKRKTKELYLYFTVLFYFTKNPIQNIKKFTNDKKIISYAQKLLKYKKEFQSILKNNHDIYKLKKLAAKLKLADVFLILNALYPQYKNTLTSLQITAEKLNILNDCEKPLLNGKELINLGLSPSKKFKYILAKAYVLQLKYDIKEKNQLIKLI
jgi:hypothetical protein